MKTPLQGETSAYTPASYTIPRHLRVRLHTRRNEQREQVLPCVAMPPSRRSRPAPASLPERPVAVSQVDDPDATVFGGDDQTGGEGRHKDRRYPRSTWTGQTKEVRGRFYATC
jgi:hypothetical protein